MLGGCPQNSQSPRLTPKSSFCESYGMADCELTASEAVERSSATSNAHDQDSLFVTKYQVNPLHLLECVNGDDKLADFPTVEHTQFLERDGKDGASHPVIPDSPVSPFPASVSHSLPSHHSNDEPSFQTCTSPPLHFSSYFEQPNITDTFLGRSFLETSDMCAVEHLSSSQLSYPHQPSGSCSFKNPQRESTANLVGFLDVSIQGFDHCTPSSIPNLDVVRQMEAPIPIDSSIPSSPTVQPSHSSISSSFEKAALQKSQPMSSLSSANKSSSLLPHERIEEFLAFYPLSLCPTQTSLPLYYCDPTPSFFSRAFPSSTETAPSSFRAQLNQLKPFRPLDMRAHLSSPSPTGVSDFCRSPKEPLDHHFHPSLLDERSIVHSNENSSQQYRGDHQVSAGSTFEQTLSDESYIDQAFMTFTRSASWGSSKYYSSTPTSLHFPSKTPCTIRPNRTSLRIGDRIYETEAQSCKSTFCSEDYVFRTPPVSTPAESPGKAFQSLQKTIIDCNGVEVTPSRSSNYTRNCECSSNDSPECRSVEHTVAKLDSTDVLQLFSEAIPLVVKTDEHSTQSGTAGKNLKCRNNKLNSSSSGNPSSSRRPMKNPQNGTEFPEAVQPEAFLPVEKAREVYKISRYVLPLIMLANTVS